MSKNSRDALVGYPEIARLTARTENSVRQLAHQGVLPQRAYHGYPVWWLRDIQKWIKADPKAKGARPPGLPRPGGK